MSKSTKPTALPTVPFVQGGDLTPIAYNFGSAVKHTLLTLKATVIIASTTGTLATMMTQSAGTTLWPYLLNLFGRITMNCTRFDGRKGFKLINIPAWVLWLEYFKLTGIALKVDDGGMLGASFAPGTYNIEVNVPILHYDPKTPKSQHNFTYFRPPCYTKQNTLQITGGTLFQGGVLGNSNTVAVTGETSTPATLVYTISGTVYGSSFLVPDLKISKGDVCADMGYEYIENFDATPAEFNGVVLNDLEIQRYIDLIATSLNDVGGGTTAFQEAGTDIFGLANNGKIETDLGTAPIAIIYAANLKTQDQAEFMTAGFSMPQGWLIIDEYDHNFFEWQRKTMLQPNAPQHVVNAQGSPSGNGANFRIIHTTANISASAFAQGAPFPAFAGM